jgi:hypothetical protein
MPGLTSTVDHACGGPTEDARVTVHYTYHYVTPLGAIAAMFDGTMVAAPPLDSTGVMPCAG